MSTIPKPARAVNNALVIRPPRPRIERDRDGLGWYVVLRSHGWLFGDRRQALEEHRSLVEIERVAG